MLLCAVREGATGLLKGEGVQTVLCHSLFNVPVVIMSSVLLGRMFAGTGGSKIQPPYESKANRV